MKSVPMVPAGTTAESNALEKCGACGHAISDEARSCPHCGKPIRERSVLQVVVGLIAILLGMSLAAAGEVLSWIVVVAGIFSVYYGAVGVKDNWGNESAADLDGEKTKDAAPRTAPVDADPRSNRNLTVAQMFWVFALSCLAAMYLFYLAD